MHIFIHNFVVVTLCTIIFDLVPDSTKLMLLSGIFWFSSGLVEGWKWRISSGKLDNSKYINYNTYHVIRLYTSLSVFLMLSLSIPLTDAIGVFLLFNIGYEMYISMVEHDKLIYKRDDFHIMGIVIKRINPLVTYIIQLFVALLFILFPWGL